MEGQTEVTKTTNRMEMKKKLKKKISFGKGRTYNLQINSLTR